MRIYSSKIGRVTYSALVKNGGTQLERFFTLSPEIKTLFFLETYKRMVAYVLTREISIGEEKIKSKWTETVDKGIVFDCVKPLVLTSKKTSDKASATVDFFYDAASESVEVITSVSAKDDATRKKYARDLDEGLDGLARQLESEEGHKTMFIRFFFDATNIVYQGLVLCDVIGEEALWMYYFKECAKRNFVTFRNFSNAKQIRILERAYKIGRRHSVNGRKISTYAMATIEAFAENNALDEIRWKEEHSGFNDVRTFYKKYEASYMLSSYSRCPIFFVYEYPTANGVKNMKKLNCTIDKLESDCKLKHTISAFDLWEHLGKLVENADRQGKRVA